MQLSRAEWYRENEASLAQAGFPAWRVKARAWDISMASIATGVPERKVRDFILRKTGVHGMKEGKHVLYDRAVLYDATKEART